jgi:hypothetical protein
LQDLETISLELSTRVRSSDEQIVELQKIIVCLFIYLFVYLLKNQLINNNHEIKQQEKDQVVEVLSDSKVHLQQDLSHYEQMIDSLRGARDQLQQQLDLSKVTGTFTLSFFNFTFQL